MCVICWLCYFFDLWNLYVFDVINELYIILLVILLTGSDMSLDLMSESLSLSKNRVTSHLMKLLFPTLIPLDRKSRSIIAISLNGDDSSLWTVLLMLLLNLFTERSQLSNSSVGSTHVDRFKNIDFSVDTSTVPYDVLNKSETFVVISLPCFNVFVVFI